MKKKIVSWLLASAMVLTCVPMNASASDFDENFSEVALEEFAEETVTEAEEDTVEEPVQEEISTPEETAVEEPEISAEEEFEIPEAADSLEEPVTDFTEDDFADFSELAAGADAGEAIEGYVLMNIPYADFYKAESSVDVVSAATAKKRSNAGLAGGSYHIGAEGSDISGVVFPVKIGDLDLSKDTKYTKEESAEALFENVSYAYTSVTKEPAVYKELNADGSFGTVQGTRTAVSDAKVSLKLTDKHADYVLEVEGLELGDTENVSAVVMEAADGSTYGLRHVNNIWRKTELGWNKSDASYASLTGKTVSKVTYITTEGIYEIKADIAITDVTYVLMNIPYDKFYEKELASGSASVDAVSSATKNKSRTGTLAGGSYHVNADGSDITGIVYPVKVNPADLEQFNQITDDTKAEITVTNRGKTSTATYTGKDALFEAPSYSYYALQEKPKGYKVLENGTFSAVKGLKAKETASLTADATASLKENPGHTDYEISIGGFTLPEGENLSAAILTTADGSTYGLRHVANIWRNGIELGWNAGEAGFADIAGKTITKISYITQNGLYELKADIPVEAFQYVLMNIPYDAFYAAELADGSAAVDAVSSATKNKSRTGTLAGGSYHVNADGSDITGVIYPVKINSSALESLKQITDQDSVDITVTNRGQTSTATYAGKDALFEAPSYAYFALSEKPARYKTAVVSDGKLSFTAVNGRAASAEAEAELAVGARHTFYEMTLKDVTLDEDVSAAFLTDADGKTYGLRHIANIWRGTQLGWNADEFDLGGKTIKSVTYITKSGKNVFTLDVAVPAPIDLSEGVLKLSKSSYAYDGKEKTPDVAVTLNGEIVSADAYTVSYANNVEIGTATVTVKGKGVYYGSLTKNFKITKSVASKTQLNAGLSAAFKGSTLKLTWGKVTNADGYEIYVAPCGSKFTSAPTKTITTGSTKAWNLTKLNGKKLNLTKNYKVKIYAYRNVDGTKTRIADGYMLHIAGPKSAAYTNAKQVSAKKSSYSVKAGKTLQLVFSVNRENSRKSNLPKSHVALLRYWSTDKSIATVSSNGKVKGVKKGTCYVYAIAANGAKKKVKITVK